MDAANDQTSHCVTSPCLKWSHFLLPCRWQLATTGHDWLATPTFCKKGLVFLGKKSLRNNELISFCLGFTFISDLVSINDYATQSFVAVLVTLFGGSRSSGKIGNECIDSKITFISCLTRTIRFGFCHLTVNQPLFVLQTRDYTNVDITYTGFESVCVLRSPLTLRLPRSNLLIASFSFFCSSRMTN